MKFTDGKRWRTLWWSIEFAAIWRVVMSQCIKGSRYVGKSVCVRRKLYISNRMVFYLILPRLYVLLRREVAMTAGSAASQGRPQGDGSMASTHHVRERRKMKRK